MRIAFVYVLDQRSRRGTRIYDDPRVRLDRRHIACAVRHASVRDRWSILDDDHTRAAYTGFVIQNHGRGCAHEAGVGVDGSNRINHVLNVRAGSGIDFVDDNDIRHSYDGLAGMMRGDLTRAQGVGHSDRQVGPDEGKVVVAAVPQDDLAIGLGCGEDLGVVNPRKHHVS